jgi:hypothetical protein
MFKSIGLMVVAVLVTLVFGGSGADAAVSAITAPLGRMGFIIVVLWRLGSPCSLF